MGNWSPQWPIIEKFAPEADKLGFWGFVMPDHYMWGEDRGGDSTLETWIALSFLAARTEKIRLGTLVTPIPFRPPSMLAKQLSTLDLISNGRVILGVGAGWSQTEFEGYSEWNESKVRFEKTREGIELILKLWKAERNERVTHSGKYYKASGAVLEPKPIQKPHPILMFGGVGERMLRMAGKYADICCIPPWVKDTKKAREIVLDSSHKYGRLLDPSFATIYFRGQQYEREQSIKDAKEAMTQHYDYFVAGFPRDTYIESARDFAKNIIPSFG